MKKNLILMLAGLLLLSTQASNASTLTLTDIGFLNVNATNSLSFNPGEHPGVKIDLTGGGFASVVQLDAAANTNAKFTVVENINEEIDLQDVNPLFFTGLTTDGITFIKGVLTTPGTWVFSSALLAGTPYFLVSIGTAKADNFLTVTIRQVPVPAAIWLFGSALMGLVGVARRKSTSALAV